MKRGFASTSDIDWSQSIADIDRQLYAKYGLTDDEIALNDRRTIGGRKTWEDPTVEQLCKTINYSKHLKTH